MYGRADGMPSFQLTVAVCASYAFQSVHDEARMIIASFCSKRIVSSAIINRGFEELTVSNYFAKLEGHAC
jgi:hypothetical protein